MENLKEKCEVIYKTDVMLYEPDYVDETANYADFEDITFGNRELYCIEGTLTLNNDFNVLIDGDLYIFGRICFDREYCRVSNVYVTGDVHIHGEIKFNFYGLENFYPYAELTDFLKVSGGINQLKKIK